MSDVDAKEKPGASGLHRPRPLPPNKVMDVLRVALFGFLTARAKNSDKLCFRVIYSISPPTFPSSSCRVDMAEWMFTEQTWRLADPGSCGCWQRLAAIFLKFLGNIS